MYVVLSSRQDHCATSVYQALRAMPVSQLSLNWHAGNSPGGDGLGTTHRAVPFSDIRGILLRMTNPFRTIDQQSLEDSRYVIMESAAALEGLLNNFDGQVINRPVPGCSGRMLYSRRGGPELVSRCGFHVPDMFVSSDRQHLLSSIENTGHDAVRISGLHFPVPPRIVSSSQVEDAINAYVGANDALPVWLQGLPSGEHSRIFVAGDTAVWSDCLAPGDKPRPVQRTASTIKSQAKSLVAELGLVFASVDVICADDGPVYCLDVNEFPIYNDCTDPIQREITSALVNALTSPAEVAA